MGEKSGGLTNMLIGLAVTVVLIGLFNVAFPDVGQTITNKMTSIISKTTTGY